MDAISPYVDEARERAYAEELRRLVLSIVGTSSCEVFLFGSRARGQARRSSDFDIGLRGASVEEFRSLRSRIEEAVEDSSIPHSVDVVDFDRVQEPFRSEALKDVIVWKSVSGIR